MGEVTHRLCAQKSLSICKNTPQKHATFAAVKHDFSVKR